MKSLAPPPAPQQRLRAVPESRDLAVSRLATTGDKRTMIMRRKRMMMMMMMMMMMALVTINDNYPHSETIHHLQPVPCAWFPSP